MKTDTLFLLIGTSLAAITVMIGAFGAHALHDFLQQNNRIATFHTAVEYQFFHTFGILVTGLIYKKTPHILIKVSGLLFMAGIILFSGSLYLLCLTHVSKWGAITPLGGLSFIVGWGFLAIGVYKVRKN